jgi:hypothetical protein
MKYVRQDTALTDEIFPIDIEKSETKNVIWDETSTVPQAAIKKTDEEKSTITIQVF